MFSGYQEREEYENELYDEEDDGLSEPDSDLEFRLYSQLHYCAENQEETQKSPIQEDLQKSPQPFLRVPTPPTPPVEVTVIDSGPDVITLSDNTEEEDSVCTWKGRRNPRQNLTSTFRNDLSGDVMIVDSGSDSSSDSELPVPFVVESDLDVDSDSDALESWMFLGQGREDGDQNIQLNALSQDKHQRVEISAEHGDSKKWVVSRKDREAQICNKHSRRRLSKRYYTEKQVTCLNCRKCGHLSKNCPTPKKAPCCLLCGVRGHLKATCPSRLCSNCTLPGHTFDDCLERVYWNKRCHRCHMTGHFADSCPDVWRQFHLTITVGPLTKSPDPEARRFPAYCYNCSRKGHFGHECSERRMFKGTYPTQPFPSSYDTQQDFKRREYRTRLRAQDLHEAGLLELDEVISTPKPPNKKAKVTPATPNQGKQKKRIAHTPKHQSKSTPKPKTPLPSGAGASTPAKKTPPGPHSAFSLQLQGKKKKKKTVKKKVLTESQDFPRSPWSSATRTPSFRAKSSPGMLFSATKSKKKQRRDAKRARKTGQFLHKDEDLFLIKQRKRSR